MARQGLVIAGLAGGSGKSVVSVGIVGALAAENKQVIPFKKGPDYIDAGWLQLAAGNNCYNLDPYLMTEISIQNSFNLHSAHCDYAIVEGNRGLFDGVNVEGGYSTAELALMLELPILLVVNCTKTTRTVAALVLGCQKLDPRLDIHGVILNQIATERQKRLITEAVEKYTELPVLGSVPRLKTDIFPMRHLGMIPHQEYSGSDGAVDFLAQLIRDNVDLNGVKNIMKDLGKSNLVKGEVDSTAEARERSRVKIGVLQDEAFQFYYSENLEALQNKGAELIYINAMHDEKLPELDGLYIGGGFPETGAGQLADNASFRNSVKTEAEQGLPIYAECGGLIYLGESLHLKDSIYPLVGIFPVQFGMSEKPQAHGYSIFTVDSDNSFYPKGLQVKGHEFRYSKVLSSQVSEDQMAVKMQRGKGFSHDRDGLVYKNVFALYTHVHADGTPEWAENFVSCCRKRQQEKLSQ